MTNSRIVALVLLFLAALSSYAPGFNGWAFDTADVSAGEGRIAAAIYIVGAALPWFL